jgi:hypothetical protein
VLRLFFRTTEQVYTRRRPLFDILDPDEHRFRIIGSDERRRNGKEDKGSENAKADDGRTLAQQASQRQAPQTVGTIISDVATGGVVTRKFGYTCHVVFIRV